MMHIELAAFGLFSALGLYCILCDLVQLPTIQATRTALKLMQGKKVHWYQTLSLRITEEIAKLICLAPYKQRELAAMLKYAGLEQSPETYIANIITRALSRLLWIIPCIWIAPLLIPIILLLTINRAWDDTKYAAKIAAEKRACIERDLPRFVSTISQEIRASRDVLSLLEGYRESAGEVFRNELEITIAAMKSGSQEQALIHLAGRVGSGMLSEVVRGLLVTLQGGDGVLIFSLLDYDSKKMEIQQLRKEAQKRPGKMRKYTYALVACIMATYLYVTFQQVVGNIKGFF